MEDHSFIVGQEFPDVKTFRSAIKEAAIAQHFELRIVKSDLIRYIAKCAAEGCPWHIRAVKLPNAPTFAIRSLEGTHTCGKNAHNGHHQASVDWIVNFIEERLRDNINYKPKDILHDVYKQYGITIPYKQAWRAKERGLQSIYGSSEEGYCLLPAYLFEERRAKCKSWFSMLAPSSEKHIIEATNRASKYQVLRSDEVEFEVLSTERSDIVNIGTRSCSCRDWQLYGIPCSHAVAALVYSKKDVYAFTERYFTLASYCETYAEEIRPIPGKIEWKKEGETTMDDEIRIVRPPKVRRPPGRPEKKRMCVEDLHREKHTVHCSRCNQTGHYKSTCKVDALEGID
ncbi:unnamed protein product [Fraxinus pennsylvanica]|uniref:SWIM-type domain-containing protein n=1 Tax=Fraxinus pennsylvanica TaxID=56036 RepID=A0AAD2DVC4_9LAMI|nr:unnamed protein product [Fraxinus pennsylvanica]